MRRARAVAVIVPFLLWASCSEPAGPFESDIGLPGPDFAGVTATGPKLVINEVMPDPDAVTDSNGEWFEVHNWGSTAVDLEGWTIRSGNDSPHTISAAVTVPAGGYALLARSDRKKDNGGLNVDYTYGTATQLANSTDWLAVEDAAGLVVDSVAWSSAPTGASRGVSDPSADHASVNGPNWTTATSSYGRGKNKDLGTPGAQNDGYIEPAPEVASVEVSPASASVERDATAQFTATAYDAAGEPVETTFTWSTLDTGVATVDGNGLATAIAEGSTQVVAEAENGVTGDAAIEVVPPDTSGGGSGDGIIVINEIMPNPAAVSDADGEWFELHNRGSGSIDLEGWTVQSNNDSPWTVSTSLVVPAGGYATFARDGDSGTNGGVTVDHAYGGGMTLANSGDWLAVRDDAGATVDSVAWTSSPTGATRGVSDPVADNTNANGSNWHTATSSYGAGDLGTPGAQNDGYVPPGGGGEVATVTVLPGSTSVEVGGTQPFTAEAADSAGEPVATEFTWSSSDPGIATVDGNGLATAWAEGTALIRATADNGVNGEATLSVTPGDTTGQAEALTVKVLDIGQGDAAYIENGGSRILIDGGPSRSAFGAHLDALGLNNDTIDVVIISHAHFDHYSGLRELFETQRGITVRYLFENQDASSAISLGELRDSIGARVGRGELIYRDTDDPCVDGSPTCTIHLDGGARMHILRPDPNGGSANDRSAAVKLVGPDSASFTMWFAGDAEHGEIDWFDTAADYDRDPGMDVDVLKGDHHGSCNGVTRRYLELLTPDWVTMSLSSTNSYGHVHEQTKDLLVDLAVPWYRTDENGTVTFASPGTAGGGYTVTVERGVASMDGAGDQSSAASECQSL